MTRLLLLFDADGDGTLDTSELTKALAEMGVAAPAEQCDAILRWFDADRSGQLDLVEFASLVRSLQARHGVDDAANEYSRKISPRSLEISAAPPQIFNRFDIDGSGAIDVDELRPALRYLGLRLDETSAPGGAQNILRRCDTPDPST